jgi:hypothetical protein
MSGLRCWPGALAYITHPSMFGVQVTCLYIAPADDFTLPDGFPAIRGPEPAAWVIQFASAQPVRCLLKGVLTTRQAFYAVCGDKWLRPIVPPPDAESTPTTVDKPQPVEAA